MLKRQHAFILTIALLGVISSGTSQTTPTTSSSAKKLALVPARKLPTIKCSDPDRAQACESFKQLVNARDKDLLSSITADEDSKSKHFAYVCFRPKSDTFAVFHFTEPSSDEYRPYSPPDTAKFPVFRVWEDKAFPTAHAADWKALSPILKAQKLWYEDHDDYSLYEFGHIYFDSWEQGIITDSVSDVGKWQRPLPEMVKHPSDDTAFESAHLWLARFNAKNRSELTDADDRKIARIEVADATIYFRYSFKNKNDGYTDYTLNIQRSTGRFSESFDAPGVKPFEDSGNCMIFKY